MRGPSSPCMCMQPQYPQQYINAACWRPLIIVDPQYSVKNNYAIPEQQRKSSTKILNPFNLSPISTAFWFSVIPSLAIGVSVTSLGEIDIYIRQALDPTFANIFSAFIIAEFHVPFSLAFLTLALCLGLFLAGKINKLLQTAKNSLIVEQEERLNPFLNPFMLAPISMTIFFPVFRDHTDIGIVFQDLDYIAIALLQALEPTDKMYSIFRFIHTQVPFSLVLLIMFLAIFLFLSDEVNKIEQRTHEDI